MGIKTKEHFDPQVDTKKPDNRYSEQEAARRRDDALRRALSTPPKPHKPIGKKKKSLARRKIRNED